MADEQDWLTEEYKGMEIYVTALPHEGSASLWDYTVRIAWPGEDPSSEGEIIGNRVTTAIIPRRMPLSRQVYSRGMPWSTS